MNDHLAEGLRHFDAGRAWEAHEAWEIGWRADPSPHRDAWKGLIQIAAAVHHLQRNHPGPVPALLARACHHLREHGHHLCRDPAAIIAAFCDFQDPRKVPHLGTLLG